MHPIWDTFDKDRGWLKLLAVIPYERILAIDDVGDEFFDGPHVYCRYEAGRPFSVVNGFVDPIREHFRGIWVGDRDERRIEKFLPEFRHPRAARVSEL